MNEPTVVWDAFLSRILPEAPGLPFLTAEEHARDAAIEFCNRSQYWRAWLDPITLQTDVLEYSLIPPADSMINAVLVVELDGKPLETYERESPDSITVPEGSTGELRVRAALSPARDANQCPQWLFDRFAEAVANGAKARILRIPEKSWTQPKLALYYQGLFDTAITTARREAQEGYSQSRQPHTRSRQSFYF